MNRFRRAMVALGGLVLRLLLSTLIACAQAPTSWTNISADDAQVPEALRTAYRDAAARLALHLLQEEGRGPETVELPVAPSQSLYQALIRVYNIPNLAARDSVVMRYPIYTARGPEVRELIVEVDSTATWIRAWRRGERLTGQPAIDHLMDGYGLDMVHYQTYPAGWANHWALVRSRSPLNIAALSQRFIGIEGVLSAGPNTKGGDGNRIEAVVLEQGWRLDYSVGWGDCLAGCTSRHYWTFEVMADGRVTYRGSRGEPAPPPDR